MGGGISRTGGSGPQTTYADDGAARDTFFTTPKGILKNNGGGSADIKIRSKSSYPPSLVATPNYNVGETAVQLPITAFNQDVSIVDANQYPRVERMNYFDCSNTTDILVPASIQKCQGRGSGRFKYGQPSPLRAGDDVFPLPLRTDGGELVFCYRVVSVDGHLWSFYNDTVIYQLELLYVFAEESSINVLGHTTVRERSDGRLEARLVVNPGDTQEFIYGNVVRYEHDVKLKLISQAFIEASSRACAPYICEERENIQKLLTSKGKKEVSVNKWNVSSEELLRWCVEKKVPFVDVSFFPFSAFVCGSFIANSERAVRCGLCKPKNYLPPGLAGEARVLRSSPRPSSVSASAVGGQGVVCALALLAEDPKEVERLFQHPNGSAAMTEEDRVDASRVTLCVNGWWTSLVVDHYFPVLDMKMTGGKCVNDPAELWVSVVEKAYAKMCGGYDRIVNVDPLHVLQDLTGCPVSRFDFLLRDSHYHEGLFDKLNRYSELGFIVVLDKPNLQLREKHFQRLGLRRGDACAVLSMKFFQPAPTDSSFGRQNVFRLLKFRNVFGSSSDWVGGWSSRDPAWRAHPAIAAACEFGGSVGEEEGEEDAVWMEWRDVTRCFHGCGVCYTHNSFYEHRVKGQFGKNGVPSCVVKMEVTRHTFLLGVLQQTTHEDKPKHPIALQLSRRQIAMDAENEEEEQVGKVPGNPSNDGNAKSEGDRTPRKTSKSKRHLLSKKKSNWRLQEVVLNSTADSDAPSPAVMTFRATAQVSFIGELLPEYSPYYLIPRSASAEGEYVLGFYTSVPCGKWAFASAPNSNSGDGGDSSNRSTDYVNAEFVRFSSETALFDDNLRFKVSSETPVKCTYQVLPPHDSLLAFPETCRGKCVR
ncbi:calpain-like cysteine peptidase [Trypanosoma grayi]|uniref:calpain-like cysteine peptidase n=1 Tax=Trypanosoma grayi TaxID=71804 RepID=UPI0004F3F67D|nr:calpain-like cysteine peptidase [Trypanosoma grayi]KEG06777.1 calpain-like cysteine peptidase [Trypanosoma grayi]